MVGHKLDTPALHNLPCRFLFDDLYSPPGIPLVLKYGLWIQNTINSKLKRNDHKHQDKEQTLKSGVQQEYWNKFWTMIQKYTFHKLILVQWVLSPIWQIEISSSYCHCFGNPSLVKIKKT